MSAGDIGLIVAEDHKLVRQGMLLVLSRDPRLRVLGEAGDGESAWRLTVALKPTVLILDLGLPGIDGLDLMQLLTAEGQSTRVLVVTARQDATSVRAALARGAHGYLLKTDDANALLNAVFTVAAGGYYVSPDLANVVDEEAAEAAILTPREQEIACAVAGGLSSKAIGARLDISEHTVRKHRENIARKLGLRNAAELVAWAIRHNL
jgi:DNA-binding NarL/FixJ family response regulator